MKKAKNKVITIIKQRFQKNVPPITDKNGSAAYSGITERIATGSAGEEVTVILNVNHLYNISKVDILKQMTDSIEETKAQIKSLKIL